MSSKFTFVSRGDIAARVAMVCATAVKTEAEIHLLACSIMAHTQEHGDYTAGESLLNGLPRGTRVKALAYWFRHFTNGMLTFKVDPETKLYVGRLEKNRDATDFKIDEACETSFADLTNEKNVESATVESIFKMLRNKATNAQNFDGTEVPQVTPEARAVASKLLAFADEAGLIPAKKSA